MTSRLVWFVVIGIAVTIECGLAAQEESVSSPSQTVHEYTNHLIDENSPYLLSHAHNPVDWYPWGDEALTAARERDKPIFLSIGYAACHWCHVMERESFEDEAVAAILNEHFVSIKVDREQRPDLDQIYMSYTTALTGSGGWPMSVFLTPELKPFFAGTYFPPDDAFGRPGFKRLIAKIATVYREDRESVMQSAEGIHDELARRLKTDRKASPISRDPIDRGASDLLRTSDRINGGFGGQPKFPHALELSLFLRQHKATGRVEYLEATELALTNMARGGIYDHLGGGFARYSTDSRWLVPHFEKMLYDNALLVPVYASAWQITGDRRYSQVVRQTLDWVLREMTGPEGAFYSGLDADSEGEEGKFYTWSRNEIVAVLGEDAELFVKYYNIRETGNFEGGNVLYVTAESEVIPDDTNADRLHKHISDMRARLLAVRDERVRPLTDDKILTSWNGLALTALCRGYQIANDERYVKAAVRNAEFVSGTLWRDGRLTHSYREGRGSTGEFLEDYAFYAQGLIDLYESDPTPNRERWLNLALAIADRAMELFQDTEGIFYLRPGGQADLIMRPRDEHDGATPAPGSVMISNLLKLNRLTGEQRLLDKATLSLNAISGLFASDPSSMTSALLAVDFHLAEKLEIVVVGNYASRRELLSTLYRTYLPNRIIAVSDDGVSDLPLFGGRRVSDGKARVYICRNSTCGVPMETVNQLVAQIGAL